MAQPLLTTQQAIVALDLTAPTGAQMQQINTLIGVVSDAVADLVGYDLQSSTGTEVYSGNNSDLLTPLRVPITAVASITIRSQSFGFVPAPMPQQPVDPGRYAFDDRSIYRTDGIRWPLGRKNITITYTGGFASVPNPVMQAASMWLKGMWLGLAADQNASSESYTGVLSQAFWQTGPGAIPPQARSLLAPYMARMIAP